MKRKGRMNGNLFLASLSFKTIYNRKDFSITTCCNNNFWTNENTMNNILAPDPTSLWSFSKARHKTLKLFFLKLDACMAESWWACWTFLVVFLIETRMWCHEGWFNKATSTTFNFQRRKWKLCKIFRVVMEIGSK